MCDCLPSFIYRQDGFELSYLISVRLIILYYSSVTSIVSETSNVSFPSAYLQKQLKLLRLQKLIKLLRLLKPDSYQCLILLNDIFQYLFRLELSLPISNVFFNTDKWINLTVNSSFCKNSCCFLE